MKLDARQLVSRILPRRDEDPPPPYSPRDPAPISNLHPNPNPNSAGIAIGLPLTRSISPRRPLPNPPGGGASLARAASDSARAHSQPGSRFGFGGSFGFGSGGSRQGQGQGQGGHAALSSTYVPPSSQGLAPAPVHHRAPSAPSSTRPPPPQPAQPPASQSQSQRIASPQPQPQPQPHRPSPDLRLRRSPPRPSPPYAPPEPESTRRSPASLHTLPLLLVHHVLMLAIDPTETPDAWNWDVGMERVRRLHWLFRDFRAVDRRFYLIATAILRDRLLPTYTSLLQVPSSNPLPPAGSGHATSQSVFLQRSREAAVLDRFVAMRLGEDLRRAESELCEDSGEEEVLFSRLQPAARVEDLLLRLPATLITPPSARPVDLSQSLPLPHAHVAVTLSPLWAQLWLSYSPIIAPNTRGGRAGRSLVVEVRRAERPEDVVRAFGQALEWLRAGKIGWGWSFKSTT